MGLEKNYLQTLIQSHLIRFVAFGTCTFLLDYLLYLGLLITGLPLNIAKTLSSLTAVLVSYVLNSKYNFGNESTMSKRNATIYVALYCVLIGIHVILNNLFYSFVQNIHIAVILAMSISVIINYISIKKYFLLTNSK